MRGKGGSHKRIKENWNLNKFFKGDHRLVWQFRISGAPERMVVCILSTFPRYKCPQNAHYKRLTVESENGESFLQSVQVHHTVNFCDPSLIRSTSIGNLIKNICKYPTSYIIFNGERLFLRRLRLRRKQGYSFPNHCLALHWSSQQEKGMWYDTIEKPKDSSKNY